MISVDQMIEYALSTTGSQKQLDARLPRVLSKKELASISDDRLLSMMTRRVFRAGMTHKVVDAKWPAFEERFYGFDPQKVVLMPPEALEKLMEDKAIIRHWTKMQTIQANAQMCLTLSRKHGGVGVFLSEWPSEDIVGLWKWLGSHAKRLGGNSAAYFLRMVGKDTFLLTNDVVGALKREGVVDRKPTSQKDLAAVQSAFNEWRDASGLPLSHISRLLSLTVD